MIPTQEEPQKQPARKPEPTSPETASIPPPPSDILHNRYPLTHSISKPLNREPPLPALISHPLTPSTLAYDRNHSPFPHIPTISHTIELTGSITHPITLTIPHLTTSYPHHTVLAALQCAGNRRHEMRTKVREVDGIDWNAGAVCNAAWTGVLLSDILASAGITTRDIKIAHVWFDSAVSKTQDDDYYGVSIPLERCLDPDYKVMLALEMNGAPLSVEHGAPVRAVIPGVAGARWTKWVTRIVVAEVESQNFYQQRDYKILPEWVRSKAQAKGEWAKHPAMMGLTINSVVGVPESGSVVRHGRGLEVGGYALPAGDDGPVVQVEVSMDGGESWREADICWPSKAEREKDGGRAVRWAWAIWKLRLEKEEVEMLAEREEWRKGEGKVLSRAKDKGGNYQDGTVPWNFRGVGYNAYGESERLRIAEVVDEERQRKGTASIGVKL